MGKLLSSVFDITKGMVLARMILEEICNSTISIEMKIKYDRVKSTKIGNSPNIQKAQTETHAMKLSLFV